MKLPFQMPENKTGLIVSVIAHAAFFTWGIVSFSARPLEAKPTDSLPVDIISTKQFSELTKGQKNGKKDAPAKEQVEKVAEPKPVEETPVKKITEKQEIKTAAAEPTPPVPQEQQKVEPPKPDKKPPPKDEIAEALKKEQIKKKQEEQKQKAAEKKQQQQPKFDPNQIAALLDKRDPTRQTLTGAAIQPQEAALGIRSGSAPKLSQSELDAMRQRLMQLWNPPAGVQNPEQLIVKIRIQLGRDGKLTGPPIVLTSGRGTLFETARDNAIRALFRGQPFEMLSPSTYDLWKEIEITFDPRDMYRG
ncbi:MAG: protein TolA [Pseudomonadota bacterium]